MENVKSQAKLKRLELELEELFKKMYSHMKSGNGQPMNDKGSKGRAFLNRQEKFNIMIGKKIKEIENQKSTIERIEAKNYKKENHLTKNGSTETSIYNIEKLKARKQTADVKRKVTMLESIIKKEKVDSQIISEHSKKLIESGTVKKWDKKPIYYFVKGLQKVALVINTNGDFESCAIYSAKTEKDKEFLKKIGVEK